MPPILHERLPHDPAAAPRLPGVQPLDPAAWLLRDEVFDAQMAERDRLIATRRDAVLALDDAARPAALELLETVLALVYPDATDTALRPDGVAVPIDRDDPLGTLGRLVQEDLCLMEKRGAEHVLTGAILCFPAGWSLDEKILRPLLRIHGPVAAYDADIARRVQRLFDGIRPGRPLWRSNLLHYSDPALFQPRREADRRPDRARTDLPYLRSERQCLVRLPISQAVVFSIHTYVVARDAGATGRSAPP